MSSDLEFPPARDTPRPVGGRKFVPCFDHRSDRNEATAQSLGRDCLKTILAADYDPPGVARVLTLWLARLRAARGYEMAVRVLGAAWFLTLALASALKVYLFATATSIVEFSPAGWSALVSSVCLLLFYLALTWSILYRPPPVAQTAGILPSPIGFAGSYLPWAIMLVAAPSTASVRLQIASATLLLIGAISMVFVIFHLGRCFSVVPQARGLVRSGPYALVRHPLYLVEEIALLGTLLQYYSTATLVLFLTHGALQVRRIFYEENLLRHAFPEYDDYARTTPRLIPYIW